MKFDKDLTRAVAETIILKLLCAGQLYGYQIIKEASSRSGGLFEWNEGTLYPCLHRLEAAGMIDGDWQLAENGRNRKYYKISAKGREAAAARQAEWNAFRKAADAVFAS